MIYRESFQHGGVKALFGGGLRNGKYKKHFHLPQHRYFLYKEKPLFLYQCSSPSLPLISAIPGPSYIYTRLDAIYPDSGRAAVRESHSLRMKMKAIITNERKI